MNNKALTGKLGEDLAAAYLSGHGYEIVARNYRFKHAEIDIIAKKAKFLIFVEVKARRSNTFGYPEEAVGKHKVKKVLEAADQYTYEQKWEGNIRFDIIAINTATHEIDHFEDAFY